MMKGKAIMETGSTFISRCAGDIYMNNKARPTCTESSQFHLFPGSALYSGLS